MSPSDTAAKLFNAYNEQGPNPWKTYDGKDVPRWDALNDQVRAKWTAVAAAAAADPRTCEACGHLVPLPRPVAPPPEEPVAEVAPEIAAEVVKVSAENLGDLTGTKFGEQLERAGAKKAKKKAKKDGAK